MASKEVILEEWPKVGLSSEEGTEENSSKISKEEVNENENTDNSSEHNSPRGVLENSISSTDSESGGSSSEVSSLDRSSSLQWRSLIGGFLRRKKSMRWPSTFPIERTRVGENQQTESRVSQEDIPMRRPSWRSFEYQELALATDNFSPDKLIGKGGHAEVYKGCLPDGQIVAVKKLTKRMTEDESVGDFLSELGIIAHVNHPNTAQLLGFSAEEGLHLVLKYSPHGSLASVLHHHGSKVSLEWKVRFKIALGIAEGFFTFTRDAKDALSIETSKHPNILLTDDYEPQISDFGLAKWLPDKWCHHIVFPIEGTFGYLAPEYFMHGMVNEKTDVFAYGVLLLELITGRRAVDSSRHSLVIWAKPLLDANNLKELIDPSLGDAYDLGELKRAVSTASLCIHHLSTARPTMNWVVRLLRGEVGSMELIRRSPRLNAERPPLFDNSDMDDYTRSKYLNDLNRHKQLALEQ